MARVTELDATGNELSVSNISNRQTVANFPEATGELYFTLLVQRAIQAYLDNQADLRLALILTNLIVGLQKYTSVDYQQLVNTRLNMTICETGRDILPGSSQNIPSGNFLHSSLASHDASLFTILGGYPYWVRGRVQTVTPLNSKVSTETASQFSGGQARGVDFGFTNARPRWISNSTSAANSMRSSGADHQAEANHQGLLTAALFSLNGDVHFYRSLQRPNAAGPSVANLAFFSRAAGAVSEPLPSLAERPAPILGQARLMRELGTFRLPRALTDEHNIPNEEAKQRRLSR